MAWQIAFATSASRELKRLDRSVQNTIASGLRRLADELGADLPALTNVKKLSGHDNEWRLRVGDYRVRFEVQAGVLLVLVLRVGHRKDVYRER